MPTIRQFRLPDAGEGLTEADIVSWKVKPGDLVKVNDIVVEIETAKSLVELPSPFAGVVTDLLVPEGATVDVGTPIIAIDVEPAPQAAAPQPEPGPIAPPPEEPEHVPPERGRTRMSVLVGYGVKEAAASRRGRRPPAAAAQAHPAPRSAAPPARVLAKPPVRKLAKDLGVDLASLTPSGPGGVVTRADVEAAFHPAAHPTRPPERPDAATATVTRIPVKGVRKATAQAMVASAFTAPHVSEWVEVDVTRSVRLTEVLRTDAAFAGVKVSPLLLVAKALLVAVRRNPGVNASWDEGAGEIVLHHDVNLGIAAATPRGLLVPNIKRADALPLVDLAAAMNRLTASARDGATPPADLSGGTITITNVGVFGVDAGTPILNPGEAMILAVGQIRQRPWVHKGKVRPRWVTTLAVSFDHRLVDGDLGSRFLADVAAVLNDPVRALAWG